MTETTKAADILRRRSCQSGHGAETIECVRVDGTGRDVGVGCLVVKAMCPLQRGFHTRRGRALGPPVTLGGNETISISEE